MADNEIIQSMLSGKRIGFAMCGSFCTFEKAFASMRQLREYGAELTPIMSFNAYALDTRFGTAEQHRNTAEHICGRKIISTIQEAEPIGPKKMFDLLICAPCTGNTLAKLSAGITDSPVTMSIKSHLRSGSPVLIAISTNDALSASAANIGTLLNRRNYYFVPFGQDMPDTKPCSAIADFSLIPDAAVYALEHKQLQPILP